MLPPTRALQLAGSDLRLEGDESAGLAVCGERFNTGEAEGGDESGGLEHFALETEGSFEQRSIAEILPSPISAPPDFEVRRDAAGLAVALEAACPRMGWRANLLPAERRRASSRWMYAPTIVLGSLLFLILLGFLLRGTIQDSAYIEALQAEQVRLAGSVEKAQNNRDSIAEARRRIGTLQSLAKRTELDMRVLAELSELVPDTAWLTELTLDDKGVEITGEAESAAPLLGRLNDARYLTEAAFSTSLREIDSGQRFQIVALRQDPGGSDSAAPPVEPILSAPTDAVAQEPNEASATLTTIGEEDPTTPQTDETVEEEEDVFEEVLR